eukprot:791580-Pelagomonas_calceolata.AAC.2
MNTCIQKWLLRFLKPILGVRSPTPSWSVLHECELDPIWFNRNPSCRTSHLLFIKHGLHHARAFQQARSANPLGLSQLVMDLRFQHLAHWRQVIHGASALGPAAKLPVEGQISL